MSEEIPTDLPEDDSNEKKPLTELKAETIKQAMGIFDEMALATQENKFRGMEYLGDATSMTNSLINTAHNTRSSEPGWRTLQTQADSKVSEVRSRLRDLSDNNSQLGSKNNSDRPFLEDLLKRAATETNPQKALELANGAVSKFNSLTSETRDSKDDSSKLRTIVSQLTRENAQQATRLAREVEDEMRREVRDLGVSQFARGSLQLDRLIQDAANNQFGRDKVLLDDNDIRSKTFKEKVRELIVEHLKKDEDPDQPASDDDTAPEI